MVLVLAWGGAEAHGQGRHGRRRGSTFADKEVMAALGSQDQARLGWALDEVRRAGPGAVGVAGAVEERLRKGLPVDLAVRAIEAMAAMGRPEGAAAVAMYAHHRAVGVRRAAVGALGRLGGWAWLIGALDDGDDEVLRRAALGVGERCEGEGCRALLARIDVWPLGLLAPGVWALWERPEVPDEMRKALRERLEQAGDPEAPRVLAEALRRRPSP